VNGATHDFLKVEAAPALASQQAAPGYDTTAPRLGAGQSCLLSWQEGGEASWRRQSARHVMVTAWLARVRMLE
jgi:hypothetical protein